MRGKSIVYVVSMLCLLASCSWVEKATGIPEPETAREGLVIAEYSYQGVLTTAGALAQNGVLVGDNAKTAMHYVQVASKAMDVARDAVRKQLPNALEFVADAKAAIKVAIDFIENIRKDRVSWAPIRLHFSANFLASCSQSKQVFQYSNASLQ